MKRPICLVVLIAIVLVFNSSVHAQKSYSDEKMIRQLFSAWSSHDADKVAAVFSEDAIYEDVTAGHKTRGRSEVRKWAEGAFVVFEDFKMEVISISVLNGRGVAEWVWSGKDKGLHNTGKSFSVRGVSVLELRGGKISKYKEFYDFATVMRQLGLLPEEKK